MLHEKKALKFFDKFKVKMLIAILFLILVFICSPYKFLVENYMRYKLRNQHVVVSFTTTPYRINNISNTIQNMLDQNIHINKIYVSIPYKFKRDNLEYKIPEYLQNNKHIHILRTEDFGPATKLLGLLSKVTLPPNSIIITIDDDTTYPKNLVLHLAYKLLQNPNQAVGLSGAFPDYDANGLINTNNQLGLIKINKERIVSVLQGFAGIAYRVEFFDSSIFDILNYPQACINSDDLYLSFYLARKNIFRSSLWNSFINPTKIDWYSDRGTAKDALHKIEWTASKYRDCLKFMQDSYPEVSL